MKNTELPKGWTEVNLHEVLQIVRGISFPKSARRTSPAEGLIACLRTTNVQSNVEWDDLWFVSPKYVKRDEQWVRRGDILISTANSYELVGKVAQVTEIPCRASLGAFISLLRPLPALNADLMYYLLSSPEVQDAIRAKASTTTNISNVSSKKLRTVRLRIPPYNEQHRIVEKIEQLFSQLDAGVAALKAAQKQLERYRQSVLKAAVEGRLTKAWRDEHGADTEPASVLLERILEERRARWEAEQLASYEAKGKKPPKNWQSRYKEPTPPDTSDLPELPDGWVWASVEQVTSRITSGSRDWKQYYGFGTGTFILAQNVRPGKLDLSQTQRVGPPEEDSSCERSQVKKGDLLVTIVGANTGDVCRVVKELPQHYVCQSVALMRPVYVQLAYYAEVFLGADEGGQSQFDLFMYGQGRPHLSFDQLRATVLPLPPDSERQVIEAQVDGLLSIADEILDSIANELQRADRLRQSILKQAFMGKLVPQDPTDEPASVLLERIKNGETHGEDAPTAEEGQLTLGL